MKRRLIFTSAILSLLLLFGCEKNPSPTMKLKLETVKMSTLHSVFFTDINTGYIVGGQTDGLNRGLMLKTTDAGKTWTEILYNDNLLTIDLVSVFFTSPDIGYAAGYAGKMIKTEDAGASWNPLISGTINDLHSIYFADADTGYAVGFGKALIKTYDAGATWSTVTFGGLRYADLHSVFILNSKKGFAVGSNGVMLKTIDPLYSGGLHTWYEELRLNSNDRPRYLLSIQFVNETTGFAVGGSDRIGAVLKTTDGGNTWANIFSGADVLYSVYFIDPDNGYAVGQGGTIIKTTDGGTSWTEIESGIDNTLLSVFFPSDKAGYIVGTGGVIITLEK